MKIKWFVFQIVILIGLIQVLFILEWEYSTFAYALLSYVLLISSIFYLLKANNKTNFKYKTLIIFYFVWGLIAIGRGAFEAQNYWDWKTLFLNTGLVMFLPIISLIGIKKEVTQQIFHVYIKYLLPFSIAVFFIAKSSIYTDGFGRFLSPLYFIIFFYPFATKKWKLIIILITLWSFFSDLGARSNMIRIAVAFGFMFLFYFRSFLVLKIIRVTRYLLFCFPILFFVLAINGVFNIFKMDEYIKGDYSNTIRTNKGEIVENNFKIDTRTFLYEEVLNSAQKRDTWLIGESAVGGYVSNYFTDQLGSKGRGASEVGILNIFNQLGIIGVLSFSLILYFSSYLAVTDSKNFISKLIGLFIAFRWFFSWIEEFTNFDLNYFFLWIMIGLCFSKSFRYMSNNEVAQWIQGIFKNSRTLRNRKNIFNGMNDQSI